MGVAIRFPRVEPEQLMRRLPHERASARGAPLADAPARQPRVRVARDALRQQVQERRTCEKVREGGGRWRKVVEDRGRWWKMVEGGERWWKIVEDRGKW